MLWIGRSSIRRLTWSALRSALCRGCVLRLPARRSRASGLPQTLRCGSADGITPAASRGRTSIAPGRKRTEWRSRWRLPRSLPAAQLNRRCASCHSGAQKLPASPADDLEFRLHHLAYDGGTPRFWDPPAVGTRPSETPLVPEGLDWDIFLGPAPMRPYTKNRFTYNWHWVWDTGKSTSWAIPTGPSRQSRPGWPVTRMTWSRSWACSLASPNERKQCERVRSMIPRVSRSSSSRVNM